MAPLFSTHAGKTVLEYLRRIFQKKPVYVRNIPFFVFVCGGQLGKEEPTLREQFIQWAKHQLLADLLRILQAGKFVQKDEETSLLPNSRNQSATAYRKSDGKGRALVSYMRPSIN